MDKDAMVNEQLDSGKRLIEALGGDGFDIRLAFWAKPTEEEKWYLYLASPVVDEKGPGVAYRHVLALLRKTPDLGIDPFEIKVIGMKDTLAEAALAAAQRKSSDRSFGVQSSKLYRVTRFGGSSLGGVSIDGAYIYPPPPPAI